MAEIIVNYLVERLLELGRDYVELIAEVKDNINELRGNLEALQSFLKDVSSINRNNESWKQVLKEIRTVVYQAEDAIDKFILEAKKHKLLNRVVRLADFSFWHAVAKVASQVKTLKIKVKDVRVENQQLLQDNQRGNLLNAASHQPIVHTISEDDDVVGLEEATNHVVDRLIGGSQTSVEAVPIFGMTGLGKSTLARKVFKHPKIVCGFFPLIWVTVTQEYKRKEVLLQILGHFTKRTSDHERMSETTLIDEIQNFLGKAGRCLIVLDDVWHRDARDVIQRVLLLPKNNQGHRVMMTTRQREVAAHFDKNIYEQEFLSHDNSWLLLQKKVFKKERCPSDLEEPGYSIAKKCGGLPLAVVVIAGALLDRQTKREWELVNLNIGEYLLNTNNLQDSCLEFVRMSYDQLSYAMKACFLYCATFPLGSEIHAWKLICLWIAEGFIPFNEKLTLEDEADNFLNDLTRKSLVMVMDRRSDGQIKTCRIHDMLYEFCRKVAKEQDLFVEARTAPDDPSKLLPVSNICRRLCVDSSILGNFPSLFSKKNSMQTVRSLLCFRSKQMEKEPPSMRTIDKAFPLIKVLELESIEFNLSKGFYQLLNLRYVSFSGDFEILPEPFGKFWNLETLIIHTTTREGTIDIKADIWSMTRLRHLRTNVPAKLQASASAATGKGCCIQSLSTIAPESCTREVFARARNIRTLGIKGNVVAELLDETKSTTGALSTLDVLENLKLVNDVECPNTNVSLPNLVFVFPKKLRKLTLFGTRLKWSEMSKLGQLESLEVLKLKEYAFQGDVWDPEIIGDRFSQLAVLWIDRTDLKTWRASSDNFPILKRLVLISCDNLEEIPESLIDIDNLEEMKLENTSKEAVRSARKMVEKKLLKPRTSCSVGFKLSVFPPE